MSQRRMSPADLRARAERAATLLSRDPRVRLVYLFGSAARPDAATARDLDLAVLAEPDLSLDERMRLAGQLSSEVGAPVDLVALRRTPVVLAHEVVETGICLFARTQDDENEFVTRTRARYWDWKPFLEEQWRLAGERLAERERGRQT
jgi:predicted nucleotidyltransferase